MESIIFSSTLETSQHKVISRTSVSRSELKSVQFTSIRQRPLSSPLYQKINRWKSKSSHSTESVSCAKRSVNRWSGELSIPQEIMSAINTTAETSASIYGCCVRVNMHESQTWNNNLLPCDALARHVYRWFYYRPLVAYVNNTRIFYCR